MPVFPLKPGDKVPLIPKRLGGNGVGDATTDLAQVAAWWTKEPAANIGLACGHLFWVLDEDDGGAASLDVLRERFGPLPPTLRSRTGSGGHHHLWKPTPRIANAVGILPGLDVRGLGGYIVAPPSVHPNGRRYAWADGPREIATAPEWLIAVCEPLDEEPPPPRAERPVSGDKIVRYGEAALEKACERIEAAPFRTQCDTLDREAYGIGRLVAGGVIPRALAEADLIDAGCRMRCQPGRRPWTRREVAWRVARAFASAAANPRAPEASR